MNERPAISVLFPVYNAQAYLDASLGSILIQTMLDFELIAVDDGSTDGSLAVLKQYARMDPRLKVISRPHTGMAIALNEALALAKGEFIARMDADDISLPQRFEKQIAFLQQNPEVLVVGSRVLLIDPDGQTLFETSQPAKNSQIEHALLLGVRWVVVPSATMMRTAAVRAMGGYKAEFAPCEELELLIRLGEAGHLANLPALLLHYRQYGETGDATISSRRELVTREILMQAFARRGVTMADDWTPSRRTVLPIRKQTNILATLALRQGDIRAAREHAFSLLKLSPLSPASWLLAASALLGKPKAVVKG